jgi:hypothetical protein
MISCSASSKEKAREGNTSVPISIQIIKKVDRGNGTRNMIIQTNGMTSGILEDIT